MKKIKGQCKAYTDALGQHGDTWDAGKLARWGLKSLGRVEAAGIAVGGQPQAGGRRGRRPFARLFQKLKRHSNA